MNEITDESMRQAYAELMRTRHATGRERCPPVAALVGVIDRKGGDQERLAVLDHVMDCPHCRNDFEILRTVEATAPAPARRTWPLALAASVLLVLAGSLVWDNLRRGPEPTRGETSPVVLLSPIGDIGQGDALRLVWRPAFPSGTYTAEILREDATVAWSTRTRDTMVTVPDSARLNPGVDYRWWVRAELEDGTGARSELRHFRLTMP